MWIANKLTDFNLRAALVSNGSKKRFISERYIKKVNCINKEAGVSLKKGV